MRSRFSIYRVLLLACICGCCGASRLAAAQEVFVSSWQNGKIGRYNSTTGAALSMLETGGLSGPHDMKFGADGLLYVASGNTNQIKRYDGKTGAFIDDFVLAGSGGLNNPTGIAFGPDGNLYVASAWTHDVKRYNGQTGAYMGSFASGGSLDTPIGILFGPDGYLYVVSSGTIHGTASVKRYHSKTGAYLGDFVAPGSGGTNNINEFTFGPDGNLYVSSYATNEIKRYDGKTGAFLNNFVSAGSGGLNGPYGIKFGPDGNLYVCSYSTVEVKRYNGKTGAFIGNFVVNGLSRPANLLFHASNASYDLNSDSENDLLFQNSATGAVYCWLMNGTKIAVADYIWNGGDNRWKVVGTLDINGDSSPDILLQYQGSGAVANGSVYYWQMNGTRMGRMDFLKVGGDPNWKAVGAMRNNSFAYLLFQDTTTGAVSYWKLSPNFSIGTSGYIWSGPLTDWKIVGLPDWNLDGKPGVLFQSQSTGAIYYWNLNGVSISGSGYIYNGNLVGWKYVGAADLNSDGRVDLLFQNQTTSAVYYWLLGNNHAITGTGSLWKGGDANLKVVSVTDLTYSGKVSLILQYATTGAISYWNLNGTAIGTQGSLYSGSLPNWNVIAPK